MNVKSKEVIARKEFLKAHGYETLAAFATKVQDNSSNVLRVLKGIQKPELQKLFLWANALHVDIVDVLNLFYPKEMKENKENIV